MFIKKQIRSGVGGNIGDFRGRRFRTKFHSGRFITMNGVVGGWQCKHNAEVSRAGHFDVGVGRAVSSLHTHFT